MAIGNAPFLNLVPELQYHGKYRLFLIWSKLFSQLSKKSILQHERFNAYYLIVYKVSF
jgi:hypothetical protein